MIGRYRKKPVVIEAIQWDGSEASRAEIFRWSCEEVGGTCDATSIFISTKEGVMRASLGDWIIKGTMGEFYPCKPDIFEDIYEPEG